MPRKKATPSGDESPLVLSAKQRELILGCPGLKPAVIRKLQLAGTGRLVVRLSRKELDHLKGVLTSIAPFATSVVKKRIVAVLQKFPDFSQDDEVAAPAVASVPAQPSGLLYQFKITLCYIEPAIWRRIQVPDCTLEVLHYYIQVAFGWEDSHLHQFEIEKVYYSQSHGDFGIDAEDESETLLSTLLPRTRRKAKWHYMYDFGDSWKHEILFEGFPPADPKVEYPLCVAGERACPPEDCGGSWGYYDLVAVLGDPTHERHEEMMEWCGPLDPEAFDLDKATQSLRRVWAAASRKPEPPNPLAGRWRITSMEQWDQDFVDEEEDGYFAFDGEGGEFHFGYVHGQMHCRPATRDGAPAVEWTWDGHDGNPHACR